MPRTTSPKPKPAPAVITTKLDGDLARAVRAVVKRQDTDISKFTRAALREKLATLGVSI